jgi:GNAT superfamily N-acetyltransferase
MKLKFYRRHWLLKADPGDKLLALDPDGQKFFKSWLMPSGEAAGVAVVTNNDSIVGFLRIDDSNPKKMWALGTWVHPDCRGLGLSKWMWDKVLKTVKPVKIHVTGVTAKGFHLAKTLKKDHPEYKWDLLKFY